MKTKLFIISLMFLLVLSLVSADLNSKLSACFPFDSDFTEEKFGFTGTAHCDNGCSGKMPNIDTTTKKVGAGSLNLTFDSTAAAYTDYVQYSNNFMKSGDFNHSFSIWIRMSVQGADNGYSVWTYYQSAGSPELFTVIDQAGFPIRWYTASTSSIATNTTTATNTWYHFAGTFDQDTNLHKIYQNGVLKWSWTAAPAAFTPAANPMYFGYRGEVGSKADDYVGWVDEAKFWNRTLTQSEVLEDYNSGSGLDCDVTINGAVSQTLTLNTNLITGLNTSQDPYTFNFNGTISSSTTDLFNCSMYIDGVLNETKLNIGLNKTRQEFNLTYGWQQTAKDINVTCISSEVRDSFLKTNVFIDSITPYVEIENIANNSVYYKGFTSLINITGSCSDPNLYSCNLSLKSMTAGGSLNWTINNSITTGISTENQSQQIMRSLAPLALGRYAIILESKDAHTAKAIKDYKLNKITDGYLIEDKIKITSPDLKTFKLTKEKDRYTFDMEFNKENPEIDVECSGDVTYLPQSEYNGHLICYSENKWIDFEDDANTPIQVIRIANNKVKVIPQSLSKTFKFKSIGDLNTNKIISYFNVTINSFGFNMYIKDEDHPTTDLIGSAEVEFNYYVGDQPNITHYYADLSGSNFYTFNITSNESTIRGDLYVKYTTLNGFTHRYIVLNTTFNTSSGVNLTLYNFNTTTAISGLKITARQNANYNYYTDVIAKLQRRYTSEGVWRTVQMDQSGDFGLLYFNIREKSTDYRIIFTDTNNNVLKTTDSLKFVCTDALCDLTTLLDPYSATATTDQLIATKSFNNDTKMLNVTWNDALGGSNSIQIKVRKEGVTGATYPCSTTQSGAGGSYQCNLTGIQGVLTVEVTGNGNIILNEYLDIKGALLGSLIDEREGAFWSGIILVICVTFGLFSPVAAIIMMIFGLVSIFMLGIFAPLSITFIIIATMISILIGMRVRS